jgi:hypothetical protein
VKGLDSGVRTGSPFTTLDVSAAGRVLTVGEPYAFPQYTEDISEIDMSKTDMGGSGFQ